MTGRNVVIYTLVHDASLAAPLSGTRVMVLGLSFAAFAAVVSLVLAFRISRLRNQLGLVVVALVMGGVALELGRQWKASKLCQQPDAWKGVEGVVTNFVPMPPAGHASEHFSVSGVGFSYTQLEDGCQYHQTAAYGGAIREGVRVRIRYVDSMIMRLEVGSVGEKQ